MTITETMKQASALRKKYPEYGARLRLDIIRRRNQIKTVEYELHDTQSWPVTRTGRVRKDNFVLEVQCQYDDQPSTYGEFTNTWKPGAIQHPEWRGDTEYSYHRNEVVRWYVPGSGSVEDHLADLRRYHSRHEAYNIARSYGLAELKRDAEPESYGVIVTAYLVSGTCTCDEDCNQALLDDEDFAGCLTTSEVGSASLWGLDYEWSADETLDDEIRSFVDENCLLDEAIHDYLQPMRAKAKAEADTVQLLAELSA